MSGIDDSWYVSCSVKLTIRFDEALQVGRPGGQTSFDAVQAETPEQRVADGRRPRHALENRALSAQDLTLPSSSVTPGAAAVSQRTSSGVPTTESEPLTLGTDSFTVIANRVPKKATFTLPHPRSAPTFNMVFDYVEFPIDPQLIRAVGVEIHLGAVTAESFAAGMRGEVDSDGRPLSILKTTTDTIDPVTGRKEVNEGTLLFYATADTWDVDHSTEGSTVTLEGREIRAILIDTKYDPAVVTKVKLDQQVDLVVADILQTIPFEHGFRLTVATNESEWPNGRIPSPGTADGMTAVRVKAASSPTAKVKTASGNVEGVRTGDKATQSTPDNGGKASYWDLITNYCELVGAMPHIVGSLLWIRPVHRIFDVVDPRSKIPTPFAGGRARSVNGEQIRVRRLVVGREIKRLKVQRKFGGVTIVPTIQTISFDDRAQGTQRLIFGQWPPAGTVAAEAKAESELLRVPMWGIRSVDQLTQIARGIYEEMGRGETGGTAETNNLASFGGNNDDPDLVRLRPLEPVEFVIDSGALQRALPISADVNNLARMSFSEEVETLHQILGDRALARAFVALSRGAVREVIRYFQVIGVTFDFDGSSGLKTSLMFQNYVVPRHHVAASTDVEVRTGGVTGKAVKVPGTGNKAKVAGSGNRTQLAGAQRDEALGQGLGNIAIGLRPVSESSGEQIGTGLGNLAAGMRPKRPRNR